MHAIRYRFISVRVNFFCRMTYFFRDSRGKGKKERKKAQAQEKKKRMSTHTRAHTQREKNSSSYSKALFLLKSTVFSFSYLPSFRF